MNPIDVLEQLHEEAIGARDATIERLRGLLSDVLRWVVPCSDCDESGVEENGEDACRICGGYGFNVGGDIRDTVIDIRKELAKVTQ